jgi:hypothetical protein|tara:strand:- start:889 stop:1245 length:357 start_codon:yes stop_codon:yes gene_type:complete
MIYLAAPYSGTSQQQHTRYLAINKVFAILCDSGEIPFSPISMCHQAAFDYEMPKDAAWWATFNLAYMRLCSSMIIICLPGWAKSKGVALELEWANYLSIPVSYVDQDNNPLHCDDLPA